MATAKIEEKDTLTKGVTVDDNARAHGTVTQTEAEEDASAGVGAEAKGKVDGVGADDKASASAYEKVQVGGTASATDHSVSASGGAFAGYGVQAGAGTKVSDGKSSIAASTSMTVGPQIGASGGASCGVTKDGVVHACVKGDVAVGLGLKGNLCFHVDTKAVDEDGKTVVDYANEALHKLGL